MQHPLALRLVNLKSSETYSLSDTGLCFVLTKSGFGKFIKGRGEQVLSTGVVLAVEGGGGAVIRAGVEPLSVRLFSIRLDHLFPLFAGHEISRLEKVVESFKAPVVFAPASDLAKHCQELVETIPPRQNLEHRSQLLRIAAAVLGHEFEKASLVRSGVETAEERIVDVFEKLSPEELLGLSVGELATKFGCSRRHLNRLFHQCFGLSVAALRMEMRLLNAVSLLRNSNMKIILVAEQCGFNHLGLFNTCFRKRFGVSPGQWRKQTPQREATADASAGNGCPLHSKGLCPMTGGPEHLGGTAPTGAASKKISGQGALPQFLAMTQLGAKPISEGYTRAGISSLQS